MFENYEKDSHDFQLHMGHVVRKSDFVVCEQQSRRPSCASAQSGKRLCYSLSGKQGFSCRGQYRIHTNKHPHDPGQYKEKSSVSPT